MRKVGVLLLFLLIIPFAIAQESTIDDAYNCLENEIENKTSETLSLQEAVFATLALGSDSKLTETIEDSGDDCWPKGSCNIRDTSQVLLAYERINKNTQDIQDYLYTKNQSASELTWFLQIDIQNHQESTCQITYDDRNYNVDVLGDMKLSGGAGSCLSLSSSGYWLQISRNCLDKEYQISCDKDFITSLLYQKQGSDTIYVSSETHSSPSSGTTEESINSQCFGTGNTCDYEGTLWATLALQKSGEEVSQFFPYLLAFAEDNQNLFPSSFLHILTSGDDQYSEVVGMQTSSGFWEMTGTKYNKFYDTALGMLSLQGTSASELDSAKSYLSSIQTPKGCWNNNNVRDTAFLLYAGWPKGVSSGGGGGGTAFNCLDSGYVCGGLLECQDSGGEVINDLECPGLQYCCSQPLVEQTCSEKSGAVCSTGQECSGTSVSSLDGSCCLGTCQEIQTETECEQFGGICSFSCDSGYEESTESCQDSGLVCCFESEQSSSSLWIWIIILVILIILVGLGIFFRDQLKMWWYKMTNRGGSTPPKSPGPPRYPPRPRGPPIARQPLSRRPVRKTSRKSGSDREMEETLKKLREMSK